MWYKGQFMKRIKNVFLLFLLLPLTLKAEIIDNFENISLWSNLQLSSNATGSLKLVEGYSGKCIKFNVNFSNGFWAQFYKDFNSINLSRGDKLYFYYKYTGNIEDLYFNLNNQERFIARLYPASTWQLVEIDLTSYPYNTINLTNINVMKFVIKEVEKGKGDLIIDKLVLYNSKNNYREVIDEFDTYSSTSSWITYALNNSLIELSLTDGIDNKAFDINFKFTDGDFVLIERNFYLNLADYNTLSFKFKAEGSGGNLEVKIEDKLDYNNVAVTYIRKFYNIIGKDDDWITIRINKNDWSYFSSYNSSLRENINLKYIERIYFTVVQNNEEEKATIYIDNLELSKDEIYTYNTDGNKLLKDFKVINSKFNPESQENNNNKVKFNYLLSEDAVVEIRIFNLNGVEIFSIKKDEKEGEGFIEWNGEDFDNNIVSNGIYIFKLVVKSKDKEEFIKNLIAVVK